MESSGRGRGAQRGGRGPTGRGGGGGSGSPSNYQQTQYRDGGRGGHGSSGASRGPPNPQQSQYVGARGSAQSDHSAPRSQFQGGGRRGNGRGISQSDHFAPQFQQQRGVSRSGNGLVVRNPGRGPEPGRGFVHDSEQSPPVLGWGNPTLGRGEDRGACSSAWSRGQTHALVHSQRSPEPLPDLISSEMRSLEVSSRVPAPSVSSGSHGKMITPIHRPDFGQKFEKTCSILVNHFPVKFNPETIVMHYDIDIKEERSSKPNLHRKVSKTDMSMIRNKLLSDNSWQSMFMTAYDGEKNVFSVDSLPTGNFPIELIEDVGSRKRTFVISIKLVNELRVRKLRDYLSGRGDSSLPRDVLQGMDLVIKENPTRQMIPVGRSFFPKHFLAPDDLGHGIAAHRGFQHSLKPTSDGLVMCLDTSVLAFRKPQPLLNFLRDQIVGFNLNSFSRFRKQVEGVLIGLKVMVTHRRTKQKYTIANLSNENTSSLFFPEEDPEGVAPPRNVSLVSYFMEKYGLDIKEKNIPCLNLGKNNRINYVPMELCVLLEGQIYPKEDLDRDAARLLKHISLSHPKERRHLIEDMVHSDFGPSGGGIVQRFGMEIGDRMTAITSRVISAPRLKLGGQEPVRLNPEKRHWNLIDRSVIQGKQLSWWAVVDFTASDKRRYINPNRFIPALISRCTRAGIRTSEPLFYEPASMNILSNAPKLHEFLANQRSRSDKLQLLLCILTDRHYGYKQLKWFSEICLGMVTQCCLSDPVNKLSDQTLANLALKINAKLGGSNFELADRLPRFERDPHVMIIGADVNHPAARNVTSPSIAAVVATMNWPGANRYAARVTPQTHRVETILNFGEMCMDLVEAYASANMRLRPSKILVFRDGVSEAQFGMLLNEELMDLKRTFEKRNYFPTVTLIVARKRHQTRLFPAITKDGGSTGNVHPGTVVDTHIVHPFEFDFFLCSHFGGIGTSKPTHYHVLWDEHGFRSDDLQQLIYNLCFTFARCTKPVSLVPPVYYADLVAYRGRLYQEALFEDGASETFPVGSMLKLHDDIMNSMFFV